MASGVITLTKTGSANLYGQIVWSSESNGTTANSSNVTASVQLKRKVNTTTGTWKGELTVGSKTENVSLFIDVSTEWVTIHTITATVSHNSAGDGSCYIYSKINGPTETTMEGTYVSGGETVTLDKISRFATILSAPNFTDEENPTITYTNPLGSKLSSLQACISTDGKTADVSWRSISKTGSSYTFSLTTTERNALLAKSVNVKKLNVVFQLKSTYDGNEYISEQSAKMTVANANPTVSFTVKDTNATTKALTGDESKLIALYSVAQVSVSVTTKKSATIPDKGIKVTHGSASLTGSGTSFTGTFNSVTENDFLYTVTDSRGNQANGGKTNIVVPYFKPKISIEVGEMSANGSIVVKATGSAYKGSFGSKSNSITIQYRYKKITDADYPTWTIFTSSNITWSGNNFTAERTLTGLDYRSAYNVHVCVYDSLCTPDKRVIARKADINSAPVFEWGKTDFKFNVPVYDQTGALIGSSSEKWENPPMQMGTEYLTKEQYTGLPVYVKMIDLGALPNSTTKNVAHSISNLYSFVAVEAFAKSTSASNFQTFPFVDNSGNNAAKIQATNTNIVIRTFTDLSSYTGFVKIKYTKS